MPGTTGEPAGSPPALPDASWAIQFDPSAPTTLTAMVTILPTKNEGDSDNLTFYSSKLEVDEVKTIYQWLSSQMGALMAAR